MKGLLSRVPPDVRNRLDNWRFWMVLAWFAIAFLMVAGYRLSVRTAQEQATREAASDAAVARCIASIPVLTKVNLFFEGERDLALTLLENSRANLSVTPMSDPVRATRVRNLRRLEAAYGKVAAIDKFPVPTEMGCLGRRR